MYYYIYKITNLINEKIYIGVHKTDNLDDGYMGSGKVIKSAIEKYGVDNFRKEILEYFQSYEEALNKEKEIVNADFLLREDVYNLRRGGFGGFDYLNSIKTFEERSNSGKRCHELHPTLAEKNLSKGRTSKAAKKGALTKKQKYGAEYFSLLGGLGKPKDEDHKRKISKAILGIKHEKVKCPYCSQEGGIRAMKRWHFANCKMKPDGI